MARKTCGDSARKRISRPLIKRKKNRAFTKKLIRSNSRKIVATTSARSSIQKRRRKRWLRDDKSNQKSNKEGAIHGSGDSVSLKMTVAKEIKNDTSHSFDHCTVSMATKQEAALADEPGHVEPVEREISNTIADGQDIDQHEQSSTKTNDFPKSWTEEMIRYYFKPNEERKNFDHVRMMNDIEYKASDWWISDADRTECRKRKEFFFRCAKCNQKGHTKKECKKHVVCYVCGEFSHCYSECPNALCLSCGRATKKLSDNCRQCRKILNSRQRCTLCGQVWHEEKLCPSKWRKYLTVTRTTRETTMRLNAKRCCYNCAQRGHFGFECPLILQSDYPPENPLKTAFPLEQRYQDEDENDDDDDDDAMDCDDNVGRRSFENTPHSGSISNLDLSHVRVILLAKQTSDILSSELGKRFLAQLSRNTNVRIELFCGKQSYIKLFGDDEIVNYCKCQLLKWKTS